MISVMKQYNIGILTENPTTVTAIGFSVSKHVIFLYFCVLILGDSQRNAIAKAAERIGCCKYGCTCPI